MKIKDIKLITYSDTLSWQSTHVVSQHQDHTALGGPLVPAVLKPGPTHQG